MKTISEFMHRGVGAPAGRRRLSIALINLVGVVGSCFATAAFPTGELAAVDDLRLVSITETQVDLLFETLLSNDTADRSSVDITLERLPLHGELLIEDDHYRYTPDNAFWAVGSDVFTYRLENGNKTSYASVHLAARRFASGQSSTVTFDDPTQTFLLQHPRLVFETDAPIKGAGSLAVLPSQVGGSGFFSKAFKLVSEGPDSTVEPAPTDNGDTDFCLGGLPDPVAAFSELGVSPDDPAGYVLLVGPADANIDTAIIRVGVQHDWNGLILEVKEVGADGSEAWHRTKTLIRRSSVPRIQVSFKILDGQMVALLRTDGLAVRSSAVPFHGVLPKMLHLGFEPSPSTIDPGKIVVDAIQVAIEEEAPGAGPGLVGPLLMTDGLGAGDSVAWTSSYGSGLQDSAAPLTGDHGFELGLTEVAFSSYQTPTGTNLDQLSVRARVDTSTVSIEDGRRLAIVNIQSGSHPLYGAPEYELRITEISSDTIASLRFHEGNDVWRGLSWSPLDGEHVVRLQIGRSDGPSADNGWARLWIDGEIAQEIFNLPNDDLDMRNVHLGAKHFLVDKVSGVIRFDEVTVTK